MGVETVGLECAQEADAEGYGYGTPLDAGGGEGGAESGGEGLFAVGLLESSMGGGEGAYARCSVEFVRCVWDAEEGGGLSGGQWGDHRGGGGVGSAIVDGVAT